MLSKERLEKLAGLPAQELLDWAVKTLGREIKLAWSSSAEDMVVLDMLAKLTDKPRVFALDTGRLPQETYDLMDRVREHYGVGLEVYFPERCQVEQMVRERGLNLFYHSVENRRLCCKVRKVEPLARALQDAKAWLTGLRRTQSPHRAKVQKAEIDDLHGGILKLNPLADWSYEQVWNYINEHQVPYNRLYDQGYKSIGCLPCTRPTAPGEPIRAGRWWWEQGGDKECGLHR